MNSCTHGLIHPWCPSCVEKRNLMESNDLKKAIATIIGVPDGEPTVAIVGRSEKEELKDDLEHLWILLSRARAGIDSIREKLK